MALPSNARHTATVTAVITRADGLIEHVGVIAATHTNPLRRLHWHLFGKKAAQRRIAKINAQHRARTGGNA